MGTPTQQTTARLTQLSPGAGCGCKLSPDLLSQILQQVNTLPDSNLLVGYNTKDDAAVYCLPNGTVILLTTDFFTPVVDDPYEFGRIAAANALSDIYSMGGTPLVALALMSIPVEKLGTHTATSVLQGAIDMCQQAGTTLAGGHSIDTSEPLFGLAVTGIPGKRILTNSNAQPGDYLYLTKPLGIGIYTTAIKKGLLTNEHLQLAIKWMTTLNTIGTKLAEIEGVHALTDVTGFGLAGHLIGMCTASGVGAHLHSEKIPLLPALHHYIQKGCVPGGTRRNQRTFQHQIINTGNLPAEILYDPQTSGGLLIAASPHAHPAIEQLFSSYGLSFFAEPIGVCTRPSTTTIKIT